MYTEIVLPPIYIHGNLEFLLIYYVECKSSQFIAGDVSGLLVPVSVNVLLLKNKNIVNNTHRLCQTILFLSENLIQNLTI